MNFRVPPYARELANMSETPAEPVPAPDVPAPAPEQPDSPTATSGPEPAPAPAPEPAPSEPGPVEVVVVEEDPAAGPAATSDPVPAPVPEHVHKVRLADVVATVENFFARNPALDRALITDLTSGLAALERFI